MVALVYNPFAYSSMARRTGVVYPSPKTPRIPAHVVGLALEAARRYLGPLEINYTEEGFSVVVQTKSRPVIEVNPDDGDEMAGFFARANPAYREGEALLVAIPVTLHSVIATAGKLFLAPVPWNKAKARRDRAPQQKVASGA